jgi:DNA (cytosine-5)-methyltransferase 1
VINGLDLFSGIGGLSIALKEFVRPMLYCEIDSYCQGVLLSRMQSRELPKAAIWDDIQTIDGRTFNGKIDIIYGGFPCQDISIAGLGKGLEGKRSGLFFEILRLAEEIKPKFIFLENVPAITTRGGLQVVRTIAEMGYDCRWCIISAASVGALHKRERWFLLAHSNSERCNTEQRGKSIGLQTTYSESTNGNIKDGCDTNSKSGKQTDQGAKPNEETGKSWGRSTGQHWPFESREHWQKIVSEMGKCSDGISNHVDRLRALGNAVVPAQAKKAFEILTGIESCKREEEFAKYFTGDFLNDNTTESII